MLRTTSHAARGVVGRLADRGFEGLSSFYASVLDKSLRAPWAVLGVGAGVLVAAVFAARMIPQEFVPSQDQSRLSVRLNTAVGANLASTDVLARRAERFLMGRDEVVDVVSNVSEG